MSDDHGKAVAIIEHSPPERMHPLVQAAMGGGQQLDTQTLAELMQLQREWEAGEAKRAFHTAMVALKADLPAVIGHDKLVDFKTSKGRTRYSHTSLAAAVAEVEPHLTRHGFSHGFETRQDGGQVEVTCTLTHAQGHGKTTALRAAPDNSGSKNPVQALASTVTYLKRYTLLSLLGIATADMPDEDEAPGDPDVVDPARNIKAVASLRKHGKRKAEAEEHLGKPAKEWTAGDLARLSVWLSEPAADPAPGVEPGPALADALAAIQAARTKDELQALVVKLGEVDWSSKADYTEALAAFKARQRELSA